MIEIIDMMMMMMMMMMMIVSRSWDSRGKARAAKGRKTGERAGRRRMRGRRSREEKDAREKKQGGEGAVERSARDEGGKEEERGVGAGAGGAVLPFSSTSVHEESFRCFLSQLLPLFLSDPRHLVALELSPVAPIIVGVNDFRFHPFRTLKSP